MTSSPLVVVTGGNGFVGSHVCAALLERGARVRALVRRAGTAPGGLGERLEEWVGDFTDPDDAAAVLAGADALVTTVHPMAGDLAAQREIGVTGTTVIARAAAQASVARLVHVSTASVYDRSPDAGDVDEDAALVGNDAGAYPVTKRDLDVALADVAGPTRVLVRPPAILGPGESSVWNTLTPEEMRGDETARHAVPDRTFAWVHVTDLAALIADVATGAIAEREDAGSGPVAGGCTAVNVAGEPATQRDYVGTVTSALGVEPVWDDEPAWTGQILSTRARGWGWSPRVDLTTALREVGSGLASA